MTEWKRDVNDPLTLVDAVLGEHIGYLISFPHFVGVCCQACLDQADPLIGGPQPLKLYHVNVYPYKQTCHGCKKTLVEPASSMWPELYEAPPK